MQSALFYLQKLVHRTIIVLAAFGMSFLICSAGGCSWMSSGQNSEGVRLFEQGNFDGAAQRFRQAMQNDPQNPDSYYNLAAYYHRQGKTMQRPVDLAQAESYYRQCLDYNPNHVDARRGLAVLLVEQNRSQEAFAMLEAWGTQNPTMAAPKIEQARLFEEFGDKDAAKEHLASARNRRPQRCPSTCRARKTARRIGRLQPGPLELSALAGRLSLSARSRPASRGPASRRHNLARRRLRRRNHRSLTMPLRASRLHCSSLPPIQTAVAALRYWHQSAPAASSG